MGSIKAPKRVLFFSSVIFNDEKNLADAKEMLRYKLGDFQEETTHIIFSQTDYYNAEMGDKLSRIFILFEPLLERDKLSDIKLETNGIEDRLSVKDRRTVNIDPGYISLENVILATTKGYAHRIYIGKGIYGDLTLTFHAGTFRALEWTYPDYGSEHIVSLLNRWRDVLKEKLKDAGN